MFTPWKGNLYDRTRLLLLGESAYAWEEEGKRVDPSPAHSVECVEYAISDFGGSFFRILTRALANEEYPTKDRRAQCWSLAAFNNFVPVSVGLGAGVRPTAEMWVQGHDEFRQMLDELMPLRIVVLGKETWDNMPEDTEPFITDNVQGYKLRSGETCLCWAVRHPSRFGAGWKDLAAIIHFGFNYQDAFKAH